MGHIQGAYTDDQNKSEMSRKYFERTNCNQYYSFCL